MAVPVVSVVVTVPVGLVTRVVAVVVALKVKLVNGSPQTRSMTYQIQIQIQHLQWQLQKNVSVVQLPSKLPKPLTGAVRVAVSNHSAGDIGTASGVGAVTNTISEVDVLAQASGIRSGASEGWGQAEHVVDACLLPEMLALKAETD